jgi:hypothetical protein
MPDVEKTAEYVRVCQHAAYSLTCLRNAVDRALDEPSIPARASLLHEVVEEAEFARGFHYALAVLDRVDEQVGDPGWNKAVVSNRVRDINDVMIEHPERYEGMTPLQVLMRVRDNVEAWLHE